MVAQSEQRRLAAAYADHFAAPLNHSYHPRPGAEGFTNRKGRNDIPVGTDANQHSVNDGECKRQEDCESSALAKHGLDFDLAPQVLNVPPHDIHSHPTPG